MSENTVPWFDKAQMEDALTSPLKDRDYEDTLDDGGPDVSVVLGAPNDYERRTRYKGAESDIYYNMEEGGLPNAVIIPEREQKLNEEDVGALQELDLEVLTPDYDLRTTFDDFKTPLDIASPGEKVHAYTSDYHRFKTDRTGQFMITGGSIGLETFGFETDITERENLLKHNFFAQSADILRQKSMAKDYL